MRKVVIVAYGEWHDTRTIYGVYDNFEMAREKVKELFDANEYGAYKSKFKEEASVDENGLREYVIYADYESYYAEEHIVIE